MTLNKPGPKFIASNAHLVKEVYGMWSQQVVGVANMTIVVDEAKVSAPLRERHVKALVHKTESDPFFMLLDFMPDGV